MATNPDLVDQKKLTETAERWLVREIKKGLKINAAKLTKASKEHLDIEVTPQTIRNYLLSNSNEARSARSKPYTYIQKEPQGKASICSGIRKQARRVLV